MEHRDPDSSGSNLGLQDAVELVGDALLVRDEWGESYDPDDFRARDELLLEASMLADAIASTTDAAEKQRFERQAQRIERIGSALNALQAYTLLSELEPDQSLLRPKQIPFMRDICDFLEYDAAEHRGGHCVIPTGVGKTVIFNEMIHTFASVGLKSLVIADTNEQVRQNRARLDEHAHGRQTDSGIIDKDNKHVGEDATYTTYASLLIEMRKPPGQRLINPDDYDLIVFDEAHLLLGENRRTVVNHFDHALKFAFTATDRYSDDKQVAVLLPHEISRMSLIEAEDQKLVAPHHNIIVQTAADMRGVPVASTGDYAQDILFESINTDERNLVAVETYINLHYGKKVIDFCGGIQHAKDLAKMYRENSIPAEAVWGAMPDEERRRIFKEFREGKLMHITNADLITTGFDMQSVECVYMLQPSLSPLRVEQIGGRANRLWEELASKVAYIVQFIDDHYVQPPVIFAEPEVAGAARHGWEGFVFPDINTSDVPYTVITDPVEVEFIALQHYQDRQKKNLPPPEGWANYDQLAALSGRSVNHLKKAYDKFINAQEELREQHETEGTQPADTELLDIDEHYGSFMNPETDGGKKRYLSPELVTRIAEHLEQYTLKDSTLWRRPVEVAAIYERSAGWVSNQLLWRVRTKMPECEAKLVEYPDSTRKLLHFHRDMFVAGIEENQLDDIDPADLVRPPERMQCEAEVQTLIDETYGEGAYELALSRSYNSPLGWGNTAGSIAYEVDGEVVQYYTQSSIVGLVGRLTPPTYQKMRPLRELQNDRLLARSDITTEQIKKEAEDLIVKSPDLRYDMGLYFNPDLGAFEYYGNGKIHAHLLERLYRSTTVTESVEEMIERLRQSDVLSRAHIDEAPEPETPTPSPTQKEQTPKPPRTQTNASARRAERKPRRRPSPTSESRNTTTAKSMQTKMQRAERLLKQLRKLQ